MTLSKQVIAHAPGKLIIVGEYAVLEGEQSLVCAVNREALVQISPADGFSISAPSLNLWNIPFHIMGKGSVLFPAEVEHPVQKRLNFFKTTFEYVYHYCRDCRFKSKYFHINIDTDAFYEKAEGIKLGFGSSAALTVALIKAIFLWAGMGIALPEEKTRVFRLALTAHRKAQNNIGSGIDIAASSFGGVLKYRVAINKHAEQEAPVALKIWPDLPQLIIFTGRSESTRRMVTGVHQLKKGNPQLYRQIIREMGDISSDACDAYSEKNIKCFLPLIDRYHNLMLKLGDASGMPIISPVHQRLHELIKPLGGVYKPSGAGSGDIGVAFADAPGLLDNIRRTVEEAGYLCFFVRPSDTILK